METLFPQDFKEIPVTTGVEGGKRWIIPNKDMTGIPLVLQMIFIELPSISVVTWNDQFELLPEGMYSFLDNRHPAYFADMTAEEINIYLINKPL